MECAYFISLFHRVERSAAGVEQARVKITSISTTNRCVPIRSMAKVNTKVGYMYLFIFN